MNVWKLSQIYVSQEINRTNFFRVLVQEVADAQTLGGFYLVVVQVVLLFLLETWLISPRIGRTLCGFIHWVILQLKWQQPRRKVDDSLSYLPLATAMGEAGLGEVETHFDRRQNTAAQFITTISIIDMCLMSERRSRVRVYQRWW